MGLRKLERYRQPCRKVPRLEEGTKRVPWNKGKTGMGIYSEEALAKMLEGTIRSNIKSVRRRKVKQAVRKVIKIFKRIKTKVTKPLIRIYRRYEKYRQKRERIKERKRKLIAKHIYHDKNWLRRKYVKEKLSTLQIAELNNVTRQAVWKKLEECGIVRRSILEAWRECKARRKRALIETKRLANQ